MAAHLVNDTATTASSWTSPRRFVEVGRARSTARGTSVPAPTGSWFSSGAAVTFLQGDNVRFDDTAASTAISLPGTVTPSNVQFSNNSLSYSISGRQISGSTALLVSGSGSVTLNTNNDYTGGTTVTAGTLQLGSGARPAASRGMSSTTPSWSSTAPIRRPSPAWSAGAGAVTQLGSGMLTLLPTTPTPG